MKTIQLLFIAFTTLCILSCQKEFDSIIPEIIPPSSPAGGILNTNVVAISSEEITIETQIFIVDGFGQYVPNLRSSWLECESTPNDTLIVSSWRISDLESTTKGPYSAMMLFDDSGSIEDTDPNDDRVKAGNAMVRLLTGEEEVAVARFTSDLRNNHEILADFTNDTTTLIQKIDSLVFGENGGTPLFRSMYELLDSIDQSANNDNKALIAFTDGDDTEGFNSPDQIIQRSKMNNIPVYTIGLGYDTQLPELSKIAFETDGAFMLAENAFQLTALYTSLTELLRGEGRIYNVRFTFENIGFLSGRPQIVYLLVNLPGQAPFRMPVVFTI